MDSITYYWDILLSQQMLDVVKRVADKSYVFQQVAHWCIACVTVQLLQCIILNFSTFFLSHGPQSPGMIHIDYKIYSIIQQHEYEL